MTTTPHGDRDRQRQRETEKEDRDRERRGDEREEDKTRAEQREERRVKREDSFSVWWCGAWPFFVDGVLCLVKPVNARVLSLPNSVKYDSSFISFSAPWQFNSFIISVNYLFYAVAVSKNCLFIFFGYAVTVSKFSELFNYAATVVFSEINSV